MYFTKITFSRACYVLTIFAFLFLVGANDAHAQLTIPLLSDVLADSDGDGVLNGVDPAPEDPCIPDDTNGNCCTHLGDEITVVSTGANTDADHTEAYIITGADGVIEAIESTPAFTGVALGLHHIYGLNYETSTGVTGLTVGQNVADITGDCFTITDEPLIVNNCSDAPTFTNVDINDPIDYDENGTIVVIDLAVDDPNGDTEGNGITYSFTTGGNGTDNGDFTIDPATGEVNFVNPPNSEQPTDDDLDNSYIVEVQVCNSDNTCTTQLLTINVTDLCEATQIVLSLN